METSEVDGRALAREEGEISHLRAKSVGAHDEIEGLEHASIRLYPHGRAFGIERCG
jgi:hypothetical protein